MVTKEEILHSNGVRPSVSCSGLYITSRVVPINASMEVYAKQEGVEVIQFYVKNKIKYLGRTYEYIWNEYQISKLKK